jgi:hypothetical protein
VEVGEYQVQLVAYYADPVPESDNFDAIAWSLEVAQ